MECGAVTLPLNNRRKNLPGIRSGKCHMPSPHDCRVPSCILLLHERDKRQFHLRSLINYVDMCIYYLHSAHPLMLSFKSNYPCHS